MYNIMEVSIPKQLANDFNLSHHYLKKKRKKRKKKVYKRWKIGEVYLEEEKNFFFHSCYFDVYIYIYIFH